MAEPSVLERCRMALTEIGIDPEYAAGVADDGRILTRPGLTDEHRWLLRCTVGGALLCWPCARRMYHKQRCSGPGAWTEITIAAWDACQAWRPFQRESCGATQ